MTQHPDYSEDQKWWLVDGTRGMHLYEEHAYTMEEAVVKYPGTPLGEPTIICGVGVRLVNPKGQTWEEPWIDVFETREDAQKFVQIYLGMDPEGYSVER